MKLTIKELVEENKRLTDKLKRIETLARMYVRARDMDETEDMEDDRETHFIERLLEAIKP